MKPTLSVRPNVLLPVVMLLLTTLPIAGCTDGGGPLLAPSGPSKALGGTGELEEITVTVSRDCPWGYTGTAPDCIPEGGWSPAGSSPGIDSGSGGGSGSSTDPADTNEEGLAAFTVCVAAKMGPGGWASVLATGISAWQLYSTRQQVRDTYSAWELYHNGRASNPDWDLAVENLFWANFQNAQSAEQALWATTAAAGATTAAEVGTAMVECAPTLAIPEP